MEKKIAKELLSIGAVFLRPEEPFTWASGIKSPIYCDNRLILSAPSARVVVEQAIADKVKALYPQAEMLMGTSTAGIAHAAIAASILGLPMGYVRGEAKTHGRNNRIEGRMAPGTKVVVIEDLISTGGSSLKAVAALREAKAEVLGMVAIFTYGFPVAAEKFAEANVTLDTLSNYNAVLQHLLDKKQIGTDEMETLKKWREAPEVWGK